MTVGTVSISYPKGRDLIAKFFPIARTDSSTAKMVLPKDAVIAGVYVIQSTAAVTGAASINVGWTGATTALLNAFSLPTSSVGYAPAGAAAGTVFAAGTKLDTDKTVICTFAPGTSTAGGTGFVKVEYFVPGAGELIDD